MAECQTHRRNEDWRAKHMRESAEMSKVTPVGRERGEAMGGVGKRWHKICRAYIGRLRCRTWTERKKYQQLLQSASKKNKEISTTAFSSIWLITLSMLSFSVIGPDLR